LGLLFGVAHFGTLLWWLAPTIHEYGNLPLALAVPVIGLLVIYLSIYLGLWAWVFSILAGRGVRGLPLAASGAGLWGITEWLRGNLFTGFPWGSIALTLHRYPTFIQSADIFGMYGVGVLLVLACIFIWDLVEGPSWRKLFYLLVLVLGTASYGLQQQAKDLGHGRRICLLAVQGSIPQNVKWNPGIGDKAIKRYFSLTKKALFRCQEGMEPRLVVWPETAITTIFQDDPLVQGRIQAFSRRINAFLLFGSVSYEFRNRPSGRGPVFYNSSYLIGPTGKVLGRYDKRHLVPFGEYMPLGPFSYLGKRYLPTAGDFEPGRGRGTISARGFRVGILICFESIFPDLSRKSVKEGANVLAVMTNDAWFGRTGAPFQHEAMSVFRAVETRRWVVRAANTGVSSIIDPWGRRIARTRIFEPASISAEARLLSHETPFVLLGDAGFFLLVLVLFVPIVVDFIFLKNRKKSENIKK